jgi:hypothetical protein
MLKSKTRTQGRKYPRRKHWIEQRDKVFARAGKVCEISGDALGVEIITPMGSNPKLKWKWKRAVDHLIPERMVRRWWKGADAHILENLYCVSMRIHAMKTPVERRLYAGDFVGYKSELIRIGWTEEQIERALKALCESEKR